MGWSPVHWGQGEGETVHCSEPMGTVFMQGHRINITQRNTLPFPTPVLASVSPWRAGRQIGSSAPPVRPHTGRIPSSWGLTLCVRGFVPSSRWAQVMVHWDPRGERESGTCALGGVWRVSVSCKEAKGQKVTAEPRLPDQTVWASGPSSLPAPWASQALAPTAGRPLTGRPEPLKPTRPGDAA